MSVSIDGLTYDPRLRAACGQGLGAHASMEGATTPSGLPLYGPESPIYIGRMAVLGLAARPAPFLVRKKKGLGGSFGVPNGGNRLLTPKREEAL
jgi:hypothetical protein